MFISTLISFFVLLNHAKFRSLWRLNNNSSHKGGKVSCIGDCIGRNFEPCKTKLRPALYFRTTCDTESFLAAQSIFLSIIIIDEVLICEFSILCHFRF